MSNNNIHLQSTKSQKWNQTISKTASFSRHFFLIRSKTANKSFPENLLDIERKKHKYL